MIHKLSSNQHTLALSHMSDVFNADFLRLSMRCWNFGLTCNEKEWRKKTQYNYSSELKSAHHLFNLVFMWFIFRNCILSDWLDLASSSRNAKLFKIQSILFKNACMCEKQSLSLEWKMFHQRKNNGDLTQKQIV